MTKIVNGPLPEELRKRGVRCIRCERVYPPDAQRILAVEHVCAACDPGALDPKVIYSTPDGERRIEPAACPMTFHLCARSARDGFSVLDFATHEDTSAASEAEARALAERLYPGCVFALATFTQLHEGMKLSDGVPDAVVVAILRTLDGGGGRHKLLGYVVTSVGGSSCIPFSKEIWPDVRDHLPRDHRRPA